MALFSLQNESSYLPSLLRLLLCSRRNVFTLVNNCDFTVWPGILASADSSKLDSTGFELPVGHSRSFPAPPGWSGRFWARTGCNFDDQGHGSCPVPVRWNATELVRFHRRL
ncbi:Thaumatin-like protein 1 [Cardamine amara subsp. amara]|uniref:Thaumatin-like protein 1 n=1 Tax=Cardamine amara subsp. amara TaxID=228776 RepID=A0ABD1BDS9_CARAN